MRVLREGEDFPKREIVGPLEKIDVAVEKGEQFEEKNGVGWEADIHERHEGNELVHIDEGPHAFQA